MDYAKKLIDALVLNSKVTYLAQVKVRIKPFPTKSVKCTCTQAGLATRKEWRRFSSPHCLSSKSNLHLYISLFFSLSPKIKDHSESATKTKTLPHKCPL